MSRDRQLNKIALLIEDIRDAEDAVERCRRIANDNIVTRPGQGERHFSMESCRNLIALAASALNEARTWIQDYDQWQKPIPVSPVAEGQDKP